VEFLFLGLDSDRASSRLGSIEFSDFMIDEANLVPETVYTKLIERMGRFYITKDNLPYVPQGTVILNTCSTSHWIYKKFVTNPSAKEKLYLLGQNENKHNLHPSYYEDLYELNKHDKDWVRGYLENDWMVQREGVVPYKNFKHELHVGRVSPPKMPCKIYRGWDHTGHTPACVLAYMDPATKQLKLFKEFVGEGEGLAEFAGIVSGWCKNNLHRMCVFEDPGDPHGNATAQSTSKKTPKQYIQENYPDIVICDSLQDPVIRVSSIDDRLSRLLDGKPACVFDVAMTYVIDGFMGGYHFPVRADGTVIEKAVKNIYSHPHDALQYLFAYLYKFDAYSNRRKAAVRNYMGPF